MLLVVLMLAPNLAGAQTPARTDLAYCQALSDVYLRYIGADETTYQLGYKRRSNLDAQVAIAKCRQGDAAAAIPVLERELIANRFSLPSRG
jgi:hypothetical protein